MPTIVIRFPARRYHATPWGHHVNEGLIEWPPSPWRLLRTLLSVGYTAGLWYDGYPPSNACSLIEKLAGALPRYFLPPACGAHSRHYMPLARFKNGREDTTLVFDTWAQIDGKELAITWDVVLSEEETALLEDLTCRLGYLGRSESWAAARLAGPDEIPTGVHECLPCGEAPAPGPGWEQIPLLAAQSAASYTQWRQHTMAEELAKLPDVDTSKKKLTKGEEKTLRQRRFTEGLYPGDIIACLQTTTSWLHEQGWSQPPGSRRVLYWRPTGALETGAPRQYVTSSSGATEESMLLSLATSTGNEHALPPVTRTLPQAELLHRALVSNAGRLSSRHCAVLRGCDEMGKPLLGRHEHGHILPLDLNNDGHLDHFLIWAPMGLDQTAQAAVRATRQTFTKKGPAPLRLAIAGIGDLDVLRSIPGCYGDALRSVLGPSNGSSQWVSLTPFVPPRFLKARGRNTIEGQVIAELESRGLPMPIEIDLIDLKENPLMMRQRHFVRSRRHGPAPPIDCGFQFRLRFEEPVHGPLCLGYGSHFGLGLFAAVE